MRSRIGPIGAKRQIKAFIVGLVVIGVMWELAISIMGRSDRTIAMFGIGMIVLALVLLILDDWRTGVLLFLTWVLFEDLARKYLGNSMTVYFAKDFLVSMCYLSYWFARRRRQVQIFRVPFIVPLALFFSLALIQVFNTWSPSILYGLIGLKLYFYYIPLIFLGYAMVDRPFDLTRLLGVIIGFGSIVAALGIAQAVLGIHFLTPASIAPELYDLTHVTRVAPITHQLVPMVSSVFVSAGRFSYFLILLWILTMGAAGHLLLSRRKGTVLGFAAIGVVTVAVMTTGTRAPFVFVATSALMMSAAFLWGAPWRWGQGRRLVKALRQSLFVAALGLILMANIFPKALGVNWAYLSETLSPSGSGSELTRRGYSYPVENLRLAFEHPDWVYGYGTGLNSLGMQYVSRFLNQPEPTIGVESGYGSLIVEMGILGPILWLVWVSALLWSGWKVVRQLRETVYFPIGFAIWWYAFVLLVLLMYLGLAPYQDFTNNAYLWVLLGVFYRLPKLANQPQPIRVPSRSHSVARWRLATAGR